MSLGGRGLAGIFQAWLMAAAMLATPFPGAADPLIDQQVEIDRLSERGLVVPVQGVRAEDLRDNYIQPRDGGARTHEALDIMAARGTPVIAVDDGRIAKLFISKPGGLTLYQIDPADQYIYFYGHLNGYADAITEGMRVKRGEVIGYVGSSGNANPNAPHLHFAIFKLGPEKQWWRGSPINPYPVLRNSASLDSVP